MKLIGKLNGKDIFYSALESGWSSELPENKFLALAYSDNIEAYYEASVIEIFTTLLEGGCRYTISGGENCGALEMGCDHAVVARLSDMTEEEQNANFCPSESYSKLNEAFFRAMFVTQPAIQNRSRINREEFKDVVVVDFDNKIENEIVGLMRHYSQRHAVSKRKADRMRSMKNKTYSDDFS